MSDERARVEPGTVRLSATIDPAEPPVSVVVPDWWYESQKRSGFDVQDMVIYWIRLTEKH